MRYAIILICFFTTTAYSDIPPGQWQCFAFDGNKRSYEGLGDSLKEAMRTAKSRCKAVAGKQKCKTAQSYCEQGPLSLIENRCVVSDTRGRSWNATGHDACKVALSLCTRWQFLHGKNSQCSVKHR